MKKREIIGLVFALAHTVTQAPAQTIPVQPAYPFFVGAHSFNGTYEVFFPNTANASGTESSWQVTVGRNLSSRIALQLGATYARKSFVDDPSYIRTTLSGQYEDGAYHSKRWTYCLPLLARYAVVRFPKPRLQVDAILGLSLVGTLDKFSVENRVNGQVVASYSEVNKAAHLYATGGVGLRYPFGRHFEGVFDWTYSKNFRSAPDYVHLAVTGNKLGLTKALSLGLRYRFAVQKKTAATAGQ